MLVLSRKPMQSIVIGSNVKITIIKIERNQVRIGIEAPREVSILRDELTEFTEVDAPGHDQQLAANEKLAV